MKTIGVAGLVIAGGNGRRISAEKPLLSFQGATLLDAVIARVNPQVSLLGLNVRTDALVHYQTRYADIPFVLDMPGVGVGPLAGVLAGLDWLIRESRFEWLASFPCDTPFLPMDLVAALAKAAQNVDASCPAVAVAEECTHNLCSIWPIKAYSRLRAEMESGAWRCVHSALDGLGAIHVPFDVQPHAFFNVNMLEDLVQAERIAIAQASSG